MHVGIENQADDGDTDDGQQNAARYLQFLQTDDHRQTDQRHNDREAIELAQRNRQAVQWVFHYHAHAVRGDQQQEQADTNARTVRNALRQIAQNPATDAGGRNDGKQYTHQEYRAQRNRNADVLAQHQAESGEGSQ